MRSRVVLPAPLGPSRPVIPGYTSKETSLTATTLPNHFETSSTRMIGVRSLDRLGRAHSESLR